MPYSAASSSESYIVIINKTEERKRKVRGEYYYDYCRTSFVVGDCGELPSGDKTRDRHWQKEYGDVSDNII